MTDQEVLEALDYTTPAPVCTLDHCTANAQYRVESRCPDCGYYATGLVCGDCFRGMTRCMSYICVRCDTAMPFSRSLTSRTDLKLIMEDR